MNNLNSKKFNNWTKSFLKVKTWLLRKAYSYKPSFVSVYRVISTMFNFEDPFTTNRCSSMGRGTTDHVPLAAIFCNSTWTTSIHKGYYITWWIDDGSDVGDKSGIVADLRRACKEAPNDIILYLLTMGWTMEETNNVEDVTGTRKRILRARYICEWRSIYWRWLRWNWLSEWWNRTRNINDIYWFRRLRVDNIANIRILGMRGRCNT